MRKILGALFLVALLSGCGDGAPEAEPETEKPTELERAHATCKAVEVGNPYWEEDRLIAAGSIMTLGDDSLVIDGAGDKYASGQAADCILDRLDVPESVRSMISSTTALMGRQSDSWGEYEATWSYHPDNGLDMVIERAA